MSEVELDPCWEWFEDTTFGGGTEYIQGRCRHLDVVPVESVIDGQVVARLCRDCDAQLPA